MTSRLNVSSALLLAGLCAAMIGCKPKVEMTNSSDSASEKVSVKVSMGSSSGPSADAMKAGMNRFFEEVMNQKKVDLIDSMCAPDYVEHQVSPGMEPNRDGLKKTMSAMFAAFPDMHMKADEMMTDGDKAIVRYTMTGTSKGEMMGMKPTGKSFTMGGVDIVRFNKDGKAVEHWGYGDEMGMMMQTGMHPAMDEKGKKM